MEYSVLESDGMLAVNVSITSSGGWEVPLEFSVILQNDSAMLGQKQPHYTQFMNAILTLFFCLQTGQDYMQISNNVITVPVQLSENASYWFELEIGIINDDSVEMNEIFTVSVDLLTPVGVSNASNLNATIIILDDDGAYIYNIGTSWQLARNLYIIVCACNPIHTLDGVLTD